MLLLSTYSLKWYWIHRIFEIAKKSSYDWLDFYMDLEEYDLWDINYIKNLSEEYWIKVLSLTAVSRWLTRQKVDKMFEIWKSLWVEVLTFSPPHIKDKWKAWFTRFEEVKNKYNFKIAIQNIESKFIFFIIPEYKTNNLEELKTITWYTSLDIANMDNNWSIDIIKAVKIFWNSMKNVFLSDKLWEKVWILPWKNGISNLPLESFLMQLKAQMYNWFITLKVEATELWAWNLDEIMKNLEELKTYYKKYYLDFK